MKIPLHWLIITGLLLASMYQTYALINISGKLSENGLSFSKAKASYNFTSNSNLGELPDMAGGC